MLRPVKDRTSWWIGLDRQQLGEAVKARALMWSAQKQRFLDHIGHQIVGVQEPYELRKGRREP